MKAPDMRNWDCTKFFGSKFGPVLTLFICGFYFNEPQVGQIYSQANISRSVQFPN